MLYSFFTIPTTTQPQVLPANLFRLASGRYSWSKRFPDKAKQQFQAESKTIKSVSQNDRKTLRSTEGI
ncbi:hypothetical protein WA1_09750 [Scytonema hofmannii PCC 7110]|uniref:Uncharacterized protein n=1 Tax=Scytonema hofmannii PCC 7110 TaxID=128403 RepID=A0A139WRF5_9CYAN|nr:hypothetical protein WA1_09750 [Scytonema hofmannii PCC 7110]